VIRGLLAQSFRPSNYATNLRKAGTNPTNRSGQLAVANPTNRSGRLSRVLQGQIAGQQQAKAPLSDRRDFLG
jgi:hypothetical protein